MTAFELSEMEKKLENTKQPQHDATPVLLAVKRPKMTNEALELLEDGIQIEVKNDKVFDLLIYFEKAKRNFRCTCHVNQFTEGWTVIVHGR